MKRVVIVLLVVIIMSTFAGCFKKAESTSMQPDVMQIRSICNLATLECWYHNVAKSEKKAGSGVAHLGEKDRKFWIEYTGIAKIGIDVSKVDIKIEDEKVSVFIPKAKLLSIDISETDFNEKSYIVSGDSWFNNNKITADDQTSAINNAQTAMAESVKSNSALLLSAQIRAQKLIEKYIIQLGKLSNVDYKIEWIYEDDLTNNK